MGTVTVRNTGDASADFYLSRTSLLDENLGSGTGDLSTTLDLVVTDDRSPVNTVYTGKLSAFTMTRNAGAFAGAEAHTYTFLVTFPDTDLGSNGHQRQRQHLSGLQDHGRLRLGSDQQLII